MKRKLEDQLHRWKDNPGRKPLLIYGARQVGKTYTLQKFAAEHYDNAVYINVETNPGVADLFERDIEPHRLVKLLETYANDRITAGRTLLIFDEIQLAERVLTSLKYFCEQAPEFHIAAAGSLLGVAVNREKHSFPVGKVDTVTLFPMDFEEYLWACGEGALAELIRHHYSNVEELPAVFHEKALELYRSYLIVGGMPAVVSSYLESGSLLTVPDVQRAIMNDYIADMAKYASTSESVKIRSCYDSIPAQLAKENKKFQYKVVRKGGTASLFGESIDWLTFAGIVHKCKNIEHGTDPIAVHEAPANFKLYMGDTGMLVMKSGISQHAVLTGETSAFLGAIAENYVAQTLAANGFDLFYWTSKGTAELDFVTQKGGIITAIEVKKGVHTQSKSFTMFIDRYQPDRAFRVSSKNFGESPKFLSIPLYAAFCIA